MNWSRRPLLACISLLVIAFCSGRAAFAQSTWAVEQKLNSAELEQIRGGFLTIGGINFSFAATVQTFVNGQLALITTLNANNSNDVSRTTSQGSAFAPATPLPDGQQLMLEGGGGTTTLLQQISGNGIRNVVATSASNQALVQSVQVTLTLAGFEKNQSAYALQNTFANLSGQLRQAMTFGRN